MIEDQTQFATEEPLFESSPQIPVAPEEGLPKKGFNVRLLGVFLGIIVSLSSIILLWKYSTQSSTNQLQPTPLPVQNTPQANLPESKLLDEISAQLDEADPSKEYLPFPAIDMDIRIDPSTR